ncbi:AraC family transcriptional regulator [Pedobacter sp. KBW06]|uniref:AraC family transcriptional regulator n=1 Tax=Pedobacter sp. KBW06 TaxID=2153359 RepID=UPI000F5AB2D8|nr:AraC family transcriptional regulator [Pedobacter sp. KBW06]RQO65905.1 AraC family transcriptional regulator [Pedobacter sp. KBW06]
MDFLHDSFAIEIAGYAEWQERSRTNNFFELVYVLEGTGLQSVNSIKLPFRENDIHLLPAAKCYKYIIEEASRFLFVRFTSSYFIPLSNDQVDYSSWFSRLNFILANHNHHPGELIKDAGDKEQVKRLLDAVLYEYERKEICSSFIIRTTLVSILGILSRNAQKSILKGRMISDSKFADLLNFISFHIINKEMITVEYLSERFGISETYFSEYFKRNAGERFQDYVLKSRLRIAESRVIYTTTPIKEIAWELGFTDSSHLNRMMKRHYGKGMLQIRKGV